MLKLNGQSYTEHNIFKHHTSISALLLSDIPTVNTVVSKQFECAKNAAEISFYLVSSCLAFKDPNGWEASCYPIKASVSERDWLRDRPTKVMCSIDEKCKGYG